MLKSISFEVRQTWEKVSDPPLLAVRPQAVTKPFCAKIKVVADDLQT